MSATIDTRKAHLTRQHGDLTFIFTWMNDERALVIVPHLRPGAPWFVVMESASFSWDDADSKNISTVVRKAMKACEVLGIEGNAHNCRRIAGLIIDSLPDLIRMPSSPPKEYHRASHGSLLLRADGKAIAQEEIRVEKEGVSYADFPQARKSNRKPSGEDYYNRQGQTMEQTGSDVAVVEAHPMDREPARNELRKLLEWYYHERDIQAVNRMEMACDADFYDNIQWDPTDAAEVKGRGQMPLVFNEVAPMIDWIIGTERRTRVDWRVMPRTEDDVELADVKTKVLKYISDTNRVVFNRSRAFADAAKSGVGWVDDGVRDDPTQDVIYNKYEDWRNVIWDSASYELDLSDARYLFRWRWVDEDIAVMMFPDRKDVLLQAVNDTQHSSMADAEEDTWYSAEELLSGAKTGTLRASGSGMAIDAKRRRVRLIEAQYRMPVQSKIVTSGKFKGMFFNQNDGAMVNGLNQSGGTIVDKVVMRVHIAVFTEAHMLAHGPSVFRHNKFSLTPVWCYRRGRDRLPYGAIRRVRDIQQDLNKRASKALFLLNTNQVVMDEGAVQDMETMRDEVSRPDGVIVKKAGKEFAIRRDTDAATGQIQMMTLDAQSIQKSGGVNQENMGRQSNAVSGEAIKARQLQGSVATTEPFDNLRLMTQVSGEKQLSLSEQFYTEEKVVRLTGAKGALDWVRVNQPEMQPDGSVRFLNDITSSAADFVVSETDYAGTMRQVMFESLNQMATRLPPEVAMRLLTIAMEFSDLPNKDEVAAEIRKMTGERDPNKEMTPEEQQQQADAMQQQQDAMQVQRETAMLALEEGRAKVRELNARAAELEARAGAAGQGGEVQAQMESAVNQVRSEAAQQIDQLSAQLQKAQSDAANKILAIRQDSDTTAVVARINADASIRVAEIQKSNDKQINALESRIEDLMRNLKETQGAAIDAQKSAKEAISKAEKPAPVAPAPVQAPTPAPAPAAPMTFHIQVDAKGDVKKSITFEKDKDGNITGAKVDGSEPKKPTKE